MRPIFALFFTCLCLNAADPVTPPVVIRSEPVSGAEAVDPGLTELRVTFNQRMMDKSWSWTTAGYGAFPDGAGPIRYLEDGRTCVMPVKLAPDTTYILGINTARHQNFKSATGQSSLPWLLTFRTAAAPSGLVAAEILAQTVAADFQAQRFEAIVARFDATMRESVPAAKLAEVWAEAGRQGGGFVAYGAPGSALKGMFRVITLPATWQRLSAMLEMSFDAQDRIAGLFLRPAPAAARLGTWRWADPAHRCPEGAVVDSDRLRITTTATASIALGTWERPGISEARFALAARVRCQGVSKPGYLELWTILSDGRRFFSRTLAESGPMGHLAGNQDWRDIHLPADATGSDARPVKLEMNVVLPAGGTVELGTLQLTQYAVGAEMVPVLPEERAARP